MKLTIARDALLSLLGTARAVVEKNPHREILNHILLEASHGRLRVKATDLRLSLLVDHLTETVQEPGAACLPLGQLFPVVREFPSQEVSLEVDSSRLMLRSGKTKIVLPVLEAENYPEIKEPTWDPAEVPTRDFVDLVERVGVAASQDTSRPGQCGVFMVLDGEHLRAVATDGHRLHTATMETGKILETSVLVPATAMAAVCKLADTDKLQVGVAGDRFVVRSGAILTQTTLLETSSFPSGYSRMLPSTRKWTVRCDREDLVGAIRRVMLVTDKASPAVLFSAKGSTVRISTEHGQNSGSDDCAAEVLQDADCALDPKYLLDALYACRGPAVHFQVTDSLGPVSLWGGESETLVVMPLRIT